MYWLTIRGLTVQHRSAFAAIVADHQILMTIAVQVGLNDRTGEPRLYRLHQLDRGVLVTRHVDTLDSIHRSVVEENG